jgi:uncharacterized protein YqeY
MIAQIQTDLKQAMLARDVLKVSTLRMAITALNNETIAKGLGATLTASECEVVVKRLVKSRQDSVEQFTKVGMLERALEEQKEIELLNAYLPKQLTEAEIARAVVDAIAKTGATTRRDMGAVMAQLKEAYGNTFDAKKASTLVTAKLS